LSRVSHDHASSLVGLLFLENKRWFAFRLLRLSTRNSVKPPAEATKDDDRPLPEDTQQRLVHWKTGLLEEEAEELEEDVKVVYSWVPEGLTAEIEGWAEDQEGFYDNMEDEALQIGRMLTWLCLLEHLESAAFLDALTRGSYSSYIQKCGAARCILNLALLFLPISGDRLAKNLPTISLDNLCNEARCVDVSQLAPLVVFRTVEVLPTLSKNWWEEDCPKSSSNAISQFVESKVAPETLRRELQRINNASNLGDMCVSGSVVSREVTATYVQDECQLSVVIQIPPNFPLRNVDVDGRKTHGIPEKRWKRWALQIRLILNSQDGTLLDALILWKENVDKEFEGVEPCPVCYSVLSVKTHELPNLECNVCHNQFHSSCLYKWFSSSGKSQCVLCQQPWSGTRTR